MIKIDQNRRRKNFCYLVCALLFERITVIISLLKALIEDQKVNII